MPVCIKPKNALTILLAATEEHDAYSEAESFPLCRKF